MLAIPFDAQRVRFPIDVQPKLNGLRCLATSAGLLSRGGKPYHLPHIQEQLAHILPADVTADGEIYCHGVPLQTILSWATRPQADTTLLEYHVFDAVRDSARSWWTRRSDMAVLDIHVNHAIRAVQTETAYFRKDIDRIHDKYVSAGYEGAILRDRSATYGAPGALMKLKRFRDDEFRIIGATAATGTDAGCVIWRCATPDGREFNVVPEWSDEERRAAMATASQQIGRWLTVRFCGRTAAGVPQAAVGIAIRPEGV